MNEPCTTYQNLAAKTPAFRHGDTAALKEY